MMFSATAIRRVKTASPAGFTTIAACANHSHFADFCVKLSGRYANSASDSLLET